MPALAIPIEDRMREYVSLAETGCWMWQRGVDKNGYGRVWVDGKTRRAHRVAYELFVGPIPHGLVIDHLCRNPGCVNPEHMEIVTVAENTRRGDHRPAGAHNGMKTHCTHGHPFDEENTYVRPSDGGRRCRACARATCAERSRRSRHRLAVAR